MFEFDPQINTFALADFAEAARKAPGKMRYYVQMYLKPSVEIDVERLLAQDAPPRSDIPFEFRTDKSKSYYHWIADQFPGQLTDGEHWLRNDNLISSWHVDFDRRRSDESVLRIYNDAESDLPRGAGDSDYAKYVYPGDDQVMGHADTGWGANFVEAYEEIESHANDLVIEGWLRIARGEEP